MSSIISAYKFERSKLNDCSAEDCLKLTKVYLARAGKNFFAACLCLQEAVTKLQKRKDNRINYYEDAGLTKERAAEMLRVAEFIGSCKSANVRTYSPSALVQLGCLKKVGTAIVNSKKKVTVADLRTLKKELPQEINKISNPAKIMDVVNYTLTKKNKKVSKSTTHANKVTSDIDTTMEALACASNDLMDLRQLLGTKHAKQSQPKPIQISSLKTSISNIRTTLSLIEKMWAIQEEN